jgi:GT2 family glycosyltransferase
MNESTKPTNEAQSALPVFIVHWNRPQECLATVKSFLAQGIALDISIIDNASEFANYEILRTQLPESVHLVRIGENKGFGGGLNVLLKQWLSDHNSNPYCVVSAHDALLQENCLRLLLHCLDNNKQIGIASPVCGEAQLAQYSAIGGPKHIHVESKSAGELDFVPFPHGILFALRKECIKQIGIFDERYFAYGDECEIGLRANAHNWKVALVWGANVVNPGSWTPSPVLYYLWARNSLLLARQYGGYLQAMLRAELMAANTVRLSLRGGDQETFFPKARLQAIQDFVFNRFGAPKL